MQPGLGNTTPLSFSLDESGNDASDPLYMGDDIEGMDRSQSAITPNDEHADDLDESMDDDDDDELEGYEDLHDGDDEYIDEDDGHDLGPQRKKSRPEFFSQTTAAAERAAIRTQAKESDFFILKEDNEFLHQPTSRVPGTFGRRNRGQGETLPAYSKKVTADLDSDDELMMTMREKGFSDKQIADKLAKDGRVRYDQKSISTRIGRIRIAQAEHVDYLLEEGYKEWQYDDDTLLMQAYELANIEVNYEIERIRAWRFRKVSEYMRRLNKEAVFSAKACASRYQALIDGTATIPSELDDDPEARRAEMEAFRESREKIREEERQAKEKKADMERKIKEETRARNAEKAEAAAIRQAEKANQKAEKAMQRAAKQMIKAQRARENEIAKKEHHEEVKAQRAAEAAALLQKKKGMNTNAALTVTRVTSFKTITPNTPDPRSYLSMADLKTLCAGRSLSVEGKSKAEFVQRLSDADDLYSLQDVKNMCRARGLNTAGNKSQLKYNMALTIAKKFASFNPDETAEDKDEDGNGDGDDQVGSSSPISSIAFTDADEDEDVE